MKSNRKILNLLIIIHFILIVKYLISACCEGYELYWVKQGVSLGGLTDLLLFRIRSYVGYIDVIGIIDIVLYLIWLNRTNNGLSYQLSMKKMNPWLLNTIWIVPIAGAITHFILFLRFFNTYNQVFSKNHGYFKKIFLLNFILALSHSALNVIWIVLTALKLLEYEQVLVFKLSLPVLAVIQCLACILIFRFFRDCEQKLFSMQSEELSLSESSVIDY